MTADNHEVQPDQDASPEPQAELAPEHLKLLGELAARRASRRAVPPTKNPQSHVSAATIAFGDSGSLIDPADENRRLREYITILEAAVALLLEPAKDPTPTAPVHPRPTPTRARDAERLPDSTER